ncbi:MAG TPA: hypothetical protein VGX27_10930 [Candidatus Dormibacteraeota bacterium]|nr:hypothetical protein [Candidatus Dormibacteraeota bacterium]
MLQADVRNTNPIVCTSSSADLRDRGQAWHKLWESGLLRRERVPGGIRLDAEPGGVQALHQLIDLERECCPWIDYSVDEHGATLTAGLDAEPMLAEMFRP